MQIDNHYSDSELLTMFRNPETKHYAFNLLMQKYQQKIYFFVRRIVVSHDDADDVVQNVFIKIWNHLDSFREDSKLFTWLYRIASNESMSFVKSRNLHTFFSFSSPETQILRDIEDDNFFDGSEIELKLRKAIAILPHKQQLVFNMRYYDDLSYEEISEVLGTSVGALKANYHIAVKKVEQYLLDN